MNRVVFSDLKYGDKVFVVSPKGLILKSSVYYVDISGCLTIDIKDCNYNFYLNLNVMPHSKTSIANKCFALVDGNEINGNGDDFLMNRATNEADELWGVFIYKKDAIKYAKTIVKDSRIQWYNENNYE